MRRSDKKANIAEANRLAEEAFMKEREMMGIPSPKEETYNKDMYSENKETQIDVDAIIDDIIVNRIRPDIDNTNIASDEYVLSFEPPSREFNLVVTCSVDVSEYPYNSDYADEHSSGGLNVTVVSATVEMGEIKKELDSDTIKKFNDVDNPFRELIQSAINDGDVLNNYFGFKSSSKEDDYDSYRDRRDGEDYDPGMYEEINEIKRITKRLLGE